jgi:hypothetical protein
MGKGQPATSLLGCVPIYYIRGRYWTQDCGYCINTNRVKDMTYAVSFLPYYWRAMQVKWTTTYSTISPELLNESVCVVSVCAEEK